jgi:hypothetical protein
MTLGAPARSPPRPGLSEHPRRAPERQGRREGGNDGGIPECRGLRQGVRARYGPQDEGDPGEAQAQLLGRMHQTQAQARQPNDAPSADEEADAHEEQAADIDEPRDGLDGIDQMEHLGVFCTIAVIPSWA